MRSGRSSPTTARCRRLRSVNAVLPREITVLAAEEVPDGFSARHDARSRAYLYRVLTRDTPSPFERGRSLWSPQALDEAALRRLRGAPAGHARLHRLHARGGYHQRFERDVLDARWERAGELLEFHIEADTFMRHMNRVLVGTMLEVATGGAPSRASARCWRAARAPRRGAPRRRYGLYLAAVPLLSARLRMRCSSRAKSPIGCVSFGAVMVVVLADVGVLDAVLDAPAGDPAGARRGWPPGS